MCYGMRLGKSMILIMMHSIQQNMAHKRTSGLPHSCYIYLMFKEEKPCFHLR
uniref:Uncharacterized protein n=1 Tax=Rhizophora mucronata TaxID=61149 RepID=A0A2P2M3A3_RHIMU